MVVTKSWDEMGQGRESLEMPKNQDVWSKTDNTWDCVSPEESIQHGRESRTMYFCNRCVSSQKMACLDAKQR